MNDVRSILVGLDFTPASKAALDQAARIAAWNNAALYVLHVVDSSMLESVLGFVGLGADRSCDAMCDAARTLAKKVAAEGVLAAGAQVDVAMGSPAATLIGAVKAHAADLLVLGVRSHTGAGAVAGPVTTACLRHSAAKVLLAREGHGGPYKTIVACTDFSETSFEALRQAVRMAQQDKAALRILHVGIPPRLDTAYSGSILGFWPDQPVKVMHMWNAYRAALEPQLAEFVKPLGNDMSSLNVTLAVTENEQHGRGITAYARQHAADLLVLGNQGKSNLSYALLGSTAERALADLPCSALVVKAAGLATESS